MTIDAFPGPAQPPEVPGLRVRTLLGRGGHGEVWSAEDLTSGRPVAVKVGAPGAAAAPLASEVALLCRIEHPHVVRLLRVVTTPDGGSAMVLELAAGGSLAALVARRGPLSAGEVSTLLVPLAGALEQVHRRGLVHGDIAPGNVLFAADGRPLLGDLGTARVLGLAVTEDAWRTPGFADPAGRSADPRAGDVWGLAAVGWFALAGRPPGADAAEPDAVAKAPALSRLLRECLSADPVARPEPAEFARRAWDAARPVPVRLAGYPAPVPPPSVSGPVTNPPAVTTPPVRRVEPGTRPAEPIVARRGSLVRAATHPFTVGGVALAGLATAALATGFLTSGAVSRDGSTAQASTSPAGTAVPIEAELVAALERIGSARSASFAAGSEAPLAKADEYGSPADRADRQVLARLRRAGRQLHGVSYSVTDPELVGGWRPGSRSVTLRVLAGTSGYQQVRVSDGTATTMPAQPPRRRTVTLARGEGSDWLLRSIA